jgi:hypothetical protein
VLASDKGSNNHEDNFEYDKNNDMGRQGSSCGKRDFSARFLRGI